jgi:hypothetical protein
VKTSLSDGPVSLEWLSLLDVKGNTVSCPHGVVSGQCNDCLAEILAKESEELAELRDRWRHGMMTKQEVEEATMQEVFTLQEAQALQGRYLIASQDYKDEFDRLVVPETHTVQVIGLDMSRDEGGDFLTGCIAVQYAGPVPKVILMNKTTYEAYFILA